MAKMHAWMICTILKPILMHIEHDYHTNADLGGHRWNLIVAMRAYIENLADSE